MPVSKSLPIGFNPLSALDDPDVAAVWKAILTQRFDTEILTGHMGLQGDETANEVNPNEIAGSQITYLRRVAHLSPLEAAEAFWERFKILDSPFHGVPRQLLAVLEAYVRVKRDRTDVVLLRDALPQNLSSGPVAVADVGCGHNELGEAILRCIDRDRLENASQWHVSGTDIFRRNKSSSDTRLVFKLQDSTTRLPFDSETIDFVIIKWALHHMNSEDAASMASEIARVLKHGGRVAVVEAMRGGCKLADAIGAEQRNEETWPQGPWFEKRRRTTNAYLNLNLDQQRRVLALEDYHGHWLDQANTTMPLPFNYLAIEDLEALFSNAGLREHEAGRRVFGMAPIIHWGPPLLRLIFEKNRTLGQRWSTPLNLQSKSADRPLSGEILGALRREQRAAGLAEIGHSSDTFNPGARPLETFARPEGKND